MSVIEVKIDVLWYDLGNKQKKALPNDKAFYDFRHIPIIEEPLKKLFIV